MFDGKTFLPVTGIPMRKMACMRRLLALADPVPLTVPIRKAKSLTIPRPEPFASLEGERREGSVVEGVAPRIIWPPSEGNA
jgi:hypothetical protein